MFDDLDDLLEDVPKSSTNTKKQPERPKSSYVASGAGTKKKNDDDEEFDWDPKPKNTFGSTNKNESRG